MNIINSFSRKRNLPKKEKKEYPELSGEQRFEICKQCQFFLETTARCQKCGCFLKVKTAIPMFHCPIDKW